MATEPLNTAGIILTGGASRRMGFDKASLVVDGQTLLARTQQVLAAANVVPAVVVGPGHIADPPDQSGERQGPMAGVVAGWRALESTSVDVVVVLSCDLPGITSQFVSSLVDAAEQRRHGAVATDGAHPQPLIAAYRTEALRHVERRFEAGERSLRRCFEELDLGLVEADPTVIADADTPQDLAGRLVEWPDSPTSP